MQLDITLIDRQADHGRKTSKEASNHILVGSRKITSMEKYQVGGQSGIFFMQERTQSGMLAEEDTQEGVHGWQTDTVLLSLMAVRHFMATRQPRADDGYRAGLKLEPGRCRLGGKCWYAKEYLGYNRH
jgi:hypothetical protein